MVAASSAAKRGAAVTRLLSSAKRSMLVVDLDIRLVIRVVIVFSSKCGFPQIREKDWAPVTLPIHLDRRKWRDETIIRPYFF